MADSQYGHRPWTSYVPTVPDTQPHTYEEFLEVSTLAADFGGMSDEEIRVMRPVSLPQINPFPPRHGPERQALGIMDLDLLDRIYERSDFTGRSSGYQGTSFPALSGGMM